MQKIALVRIVLIMIAVLSTGAGHDGEFYLSQAARQAVAPAPPPVLPDHEIELINRLTANQRKILIHVADYLTSKEIAEKLEVSFRTVQNHRANIVQVLDMNGLHRLLEFAVRNRKKL